jgi:anti-sigma28 factor (negative regulator of flagellin synthesis)
MGAAGAARARETAPGAGKAGGEPASSASPWSAGDGDLSELVRSLRSLAADSPERQARIEDLMRAYASGAYAVDPQATAQAIIDAAAGQRRRGGRGSRRRPQASIRGT